MDFGDALLTAAKRVRKLVTLVPLGSYPYVARHLRVELGLTRGTHVPPWTAGFWIGQLHLASKVLDDTALNSRLLQEVDLATDVLLTRAEMFDHDIGFLALLSLTPGLGDHIAPRQEAALLQACRALADRFDPEGRFIRAHGWRGSAGHTIASPGDNDGPPGRFIADTWMNLPLLYWGADHFGESFLAEVANEHAETAMRLLMTPSGWTLHGYDIRPSDGAAGPSTIQGATATSPWARAQAWTIYGLMLCSQQTGRSDWADASRGLLQLFTRECRPDGIAPWDFSYPEGAETVPDTSASAIAASAAMLGAADHAKARAMAQSVVPWTERKLAGTGALGGGCYFFTEGIGIGEPCAWGDYFWMETCARGLGLRVPYDLGTRTLLANVLS